MDKSRYSASRRPRRRWPARSAFALAMVALAAACATAPGRSVDPLETAASAIALEAGPLEEALLPQDGPGAAGYLAFADSVEGDYRFAGERRVGTVEAGGYRIGAVLLLPSDLPPGGRPRGTVVAFHGYMSYGGRILGALERVAEGGWAVISADLPGHGFSDGERGDIRDFAEYGRAASGLLAWAESQVRFDLPRPFVLLGHSTGGSAVLESLWSGGEGGAAADAAVLLAPLVKPVGFWASAPAPLLAPFVRSFASRRHVDGFLGLPRMPLHWLQALVQWNRRLPGRPPLDIPALIVQGADDHVVDWRSNVPFLAGKIPGAKVVYLKGRGHLLLENREARAESLAIIARFLDGLPVDTRLSSGMK